MPHVNPGDTDDVLLFRYCCFSFDLFAPSCWAGVISPVKELHLPSWQRGRPRTYGLVWRRSLQLSCRWPLYLPPDDNPAYGMSSGIRLSLVSTHESARREAVLSLRVPSEWSGPCRWCPVTAWGCDGGGCFAAAVHVGFQCHAGLCDWHLLRFSMSSGLLIVSYWALSAKCPGGLWGLKQ